MRSCCWSRRGRGTIAGKWTQVVSCGAHHSRAGLTIAALAVQPREEADNAELIEVVVHVLKEGIEKVRSAKKSGDPQMRLEKYLICVVSYMRVFPRPEFELIHHFSKLERFSRLEEAAAVWEELTTLKSTSYAVWYGHADFET